MATLSDLRVILLDLSQPIAKRTHAAFKLRTSATAECASVIAEALLNTQDSSLMRHELAYILGQMQYKHICSTLIQILEDESEDLLVRHECAEVSTRYRILHFDSLEFFINPIKGNGSYWS